MSENMMNNGNTAVMNKKETRKAKQALAAQQTTTGLIGVVVVTENTQPEVITQGVVVVTQPDATADAKKKNHNGPFATREDAVLRPVKGERKAKVKDGTGKAARMVQAKNPDGTDKMEEFTHTIFNLSVPVAALQRMIDAAKDGIYRQYWYGVTAVNAYANFASSNGVVASQGDGSGRANAYAALVGRASEMEMRATKAENDKIQAEKDSIAGMVGMLGHMNAETRDMCLAGMAPHIRQAVMAAMANGSTLGTPAITAAQ